MREVSFYKTWNLEKNNATTEVSTSSVAGGVDIIPLNHLCYFKIWKKYFNK